ncbi:MAG: glycosyl hydrolase [Chitinophagaceae bacterium]|nr:MAG: glycosyl hydrolase [Chitinophagaceae bacterium]
MAPGITFFISFLMACSPKTGIQKLPVNSSMVSVATLQPVIKGLGTNPLLQIRIYIPEGNKDITFRTMSGTLSEAALRNVENLELFYTGSEPQFSSKVAATSIAPTSRNFELPVAKTLSAGVNYLWLSAKLKDNADIDDIIEIHATALTDGSGKQYGLTENNAHFKKRIGVAVRTAWQDSVHTYRIPGIITTDLNTLIAVYDIRYKNSGDLPGNIDVGMSRSKDGGKTWEPMKIIMDMGTPHENNGVGDPSVLFDPVTKKIWVAALWSKGNRSIAGSKPGMSPDETGQFVVVSSGDDGKTWSAPVSITPQVKDPAWKLFFPGPGNGIAMQDGKLVFPAQYWDADHMPHSNLIFSADHGLTWKRGSGAKSNTTESQLVETTTGTIMLNMRDNRGGFRTIATTRNLGSSWTEHSTSYQALPDPVCMASFIKADVNYKGRNKELLFFSNMASQNERHHLTIKASPDLGESWLPGGLMIDERRSFGYSAMTRIDANTIGLLYEGIRDLYFVRVPVSDITR